MNVIILHLVIIVQSFTSRKINRPSKDPWNPDWFQSCSKNLNIPPVIPTANPCRRTKSTRKAQDTHTTCQKECLVTRSAIRFFSRKFPDYKTLTSLFNQCGLVTDGSCAYNKGGAYSSNARTRPVYPTCSCFTQNASDQSWRKISLLYCRLGIAIVITRKGITIEQSSEAEGLTQPKNKNKSRTGSLREILEMKNPAIFENTDEEANIGEQEEEDWSSSRWTFFGPSRRALLVADLRVSGKRMWAVVDTGSSVTLIDYNLAKLIYDKPIATYDISDKAMIILGKTMVDVEMKKGITIPVAGLVVHNFEYGILLGNDFFLQYAANIKISEGVMSILLNQANFIFAIKMRNHGSIFYTDTDSRSFPTPLRISARLNGLQTEICIDTGAPMSVVYKEVVNPLSIVPVRSNRKYFSTGNTLVSFLGEADIELLIEGKKITTTAMVVQSGPAYPFVAGNLFNRQYIENIDFEEQIVTLRSPGKNKRVTTQSFVTAFSSHFCEKNPE